MELAYLLLLGLEGSCSHVIAVVMVEAGCLSTTHRVMVEVGCSPATAVVMVGGEEGGGCVYLLKLKWR